MLSLAFLIIDMMVVGCTLHYVQFCLFKAPHALYVSGDPYPLYKSSTYLRYVYYLCAFGGFFIAIYGGIHKLLVWAPDSWLNPDEKSTGHDIPYKDVLALFSGLFGGLMLMDALRKASDQLEELEARRFDKAKMIDDAWRKTDDAKHWVEMEDGEIVEKKYLNWERLKYKTWTSCYTPPEG
jgi:hypothetical protein